MLVQATHQEGERREEEEKYLLPLLPRHAHHTPGIILYIDVNMHVLFSS